MCRTRRTPRRPQKAESPPPPEFVDGTNDLALLPIDQLRAALVQEHYHPAVVKALPDFLVVKCIRELQTRFDNWNHCPNPVFGPDASTPYHLLSRFNPSFLCNGYPETIISMPRPGIEIQALQTNVDSEAPVAEKPIPDTLPMDLNVKLLDCGVLQSTIDSLTKEKIGQIIDAFEARLDPVDVVAAIGLKIGNTSRIIADSQIGQTSESEKETEEEDRDDEDDPRRTRF
jgi:hypothetical protein